MKHNDILRVSLMTELERYMELAPLIIKNIYETRPSVQIDEIIVAPHEPEIKVCFSCDDHSFYAVTTIDHRTKRPYAWLEILVHKFSEEEESELVDCYHHLNRELGITILIRGTSMFIGVEYVEMDSVHDIASVMRDLIEKKETFIKCSESSKMSASEMDALMNLSSGASLKH